MKPVHKPHHVAETLSPQRRRGNPTAFTHYECNFLPLVVGIAQCPHHPWARWRMGTLVWKRFSWMCSIDNCPCWWWWDTLYRSPPSEVDLQRLAKWVEPQQQQQQQYTSNSTISLPPEVHVQCLDETEVEQQCGPTPTISLPGACNKDTAPAAKRRRMTPRETREVQATWERHKRLELMSEAMGLVKHVVDVVGVDKGMVGSNKGEVIIIDDM